MVTQDAVATLQRLFGRIAEWSLLESWINMNITPNDRVQSEVKLIPMGIALITLLGAVSVIAVSQQIQKLRSLDRPNRPSQHHT